MLLEEIKQQGQTTIILQQQILGARNGGDSQLPPSVDGRLPATTTEELMLLDREAGDKEIYASLVRILFILLLSYNTFSYEVALCAEFIMCEKCSFLLTSFPLIMMTNV